MRTVRATHAAVGSTRDTSRQDLQARVRELAAANDSLRLDIAREAGHFQSLLVELALAAQRLGDWQLAKVIREVAAHPDDRRCVAACGAHDEPSAARTEPGRERCPNSALQLSARERQVLRLLTEGSRSPCIATQLSISPATVEVHRRNIIRKLDLHSIAALTKYAIREGLTSL